MIPLMGRVIAQKKFPNLINDPTAEEIIKKIDYDFSSQEKKMTSLFGVYGALEVSQREYDLEWEINDYLKSNPKASVVNLGCGLDDLFNRVNNGKCRGFNIDFEDVITARNELLPPLDNEKNIIPLGVIDDKGMAALVVGIGAGIIDGSYVGEVVEEHVAPLLFRIELAEAHQVAARIGSGGRDVEILAQSVGGIVGDGA